MNKLIKTTTAAIAAGLIFASGGNINAYAQRISVSPANHSNYTETEIRRKEKEQQAPETSPAPSSSPTTQMDGTFVQALTNQYDGYASGIASEYDQQNRINIQGANAEYLPEISRQIQCMVRDCNGSKMAVDPNAYIVQSEDGLWLVMGNIRAKLDILIYVDPKNTQDAQAYNNNGNQSIPARTLESQQDNQNLQGQQNNQNLQGQQQDNQNLQGQQQNTQSQSIPIYGR